MPTIHFHLVLALSETDPISLKKPFQYLLVLLGCLHMAGGPYSLIQVYAWANMLVSYSQDGGIVQAARDTFSGEKPCHLCEKIAASKEDEQRPSSPPLPVAQFSTMLLQEMLPSGNIRLAPPRIHDWFPPGFIELAASHGIGANSPPIPPPLFG